MRLSLARAPISRGWFGSVIEIPRESASTDRTLVSSADMPPDLQRGEGRHDTGHQPAESLADEPLHISGIHVRMATGDIVAFADCQDVVDRGGYGRMFVLPRMAEVLRQVALSDQHHPDPR